MRSQWLVGPTVLAGCLAAAPASAWDVQTTAIFSNDTGQQGNPDMHGEVPNVWINSGQDWSHTSYYTGIQGRGYHLTLTLRDGRFCRANVLVRTDRTGGPSTGGSVYCSIANYDYGGLSCTLQQSNAIHAEKRCEFKFSYY